MPTDNSEVPQPILRWVGGKRQLLSRLIEHCPDDAQGRRYYEPFLGAASLFLALRPNTAILSDANAHLIDTYKTVKRDPKAVAKRLAAYARRDCAEQYYRVRSLYNRSMPGVLQAARFIYLNRTCFNGIFRVNRDGKFNVPYGYRATPKFPSRTELSNLALALKRVKLHTSDYAAAIDRARSGDFIYLDPPYPPLNGTSFFAHYTMDRFGENDQLRLAKTVRMLAKRGCLILMSNADTPLVRKLYRGLHMRSLPVNRWVTCKASKHVVHELVITSY